MRVDSVTDMPVALHRMDGNPTPNQALRRAVEVAGGQSALARMIGRSQQAISDRLGGDLSLWAEDVLKVERETAVPRWQLRPDIYPPEEYAGTAALAAGEDAA